MNRCQCLNISLMINSWQQPKKINSHSTNQVSRLGPRWAQRKVLWQYCDKYYQIMQFNPPICWWVPHATKRCQCLWYHTRHTNCFHEARNQWNSKSVSRTPLSSGMEQGNSFLHREDVQDLSTTAKGWFQEWPITSNPLFEIACWRVQPNPPRKYFPADYHGLG